MSKRLAGSGPASTRFSQLPLDPFKQWVGGSPVKRSFIMYPAARVEDWRVDYRVRWLFRRFRFGPLRLPYHVSSPRSPNRTCCLGSNRSPLASVDDSHGFGTRPLLHPRSSRSFLTTPSSSDDPFTFACDASGSPVLLPGFQASRDPSPFGHPAPSLHRHYPASPVSLSATLGPASP